MVAVRKVDVVGLGEVARAAGVAERPPRRDSTAIPLDDVLLADEVARLRGLSLLFAGLGASAAWFPLLGGDPVLQVAALITCGWFAVVCVVVRLRAKPDASYRRLFRWYAVSAVVPVVPLLLYFGVFSPAPIAITLGISFLGTAEDRRWGLGSCIAGIIAYLAVATAVMTGLIEDRGLIHATCLGDPQSFAIVMVPLIFLGTMRQARLSKRATRNALADVESAVRAAQKREAQLAEANQDLARVLELPLGRRGAYSGRHAGAWLLGEVIGRGAVGEVYAATHVTMRTTAAVKVLVSSSAHRLVRFRRELDIASRLRAHGLVAVYEAGVLDGDVPFLVMELLRGHDLGWHLRRAGQLDLTDALELCDQVSSGLREAHAAGIVHRDIKPQNLFLHERAARTPTWKILDFGMSRLRESRGTLTQNAVVGTPGYMPPEQARGQRTDERSDLFALAAVLYRSLTGQPPFRGRDTPQILFEIVYTAPRRPSALVPGLPIDVDLFFAIALAKLPADRFASTTELAAAFQAAARNMLPPDVRGRARELLAGLPWR